MKDINFLPQEYREARRRHDSRVSRAWLAMIGLCALGIWFGAGTFQLREAQAQLAHLEQQNRMVQTGLEVMDQLKGEHDKLLERYRLAQQLTPRPSCVQTLNKLAELIPPQVIVEKLDVVSKKGQSRPGRSNKLAQLADRISAENPLEKASQPEIRELHLSIIGLALSEMDVAILIGRLSSCQDFRNVQLEYCRSGTVEKYQASTFKVTLVSGVLPSVLSHNEDSLSLEALD